MDYVFMKRGLFERPNHQGYTGIKDEAGRYTEADFHPADDSIGLKHIPWDDAPDFAPACFHDLMQRHLEKKITAQREVMQKAYDHLRRHPTGARGWNALLNKLEAALATENAVEPP